MRWLILLMLSGLAVAQGVRIGDSVPTMTTASVSGSTVLAPIVPANIQICSYPANAVPCTNKATTYTDSTLGTSCGSTSQVVLAATTTCTNTSDSRGNWGAWVAAGTYDWTFTTSGGSSYGPYTVTAANPITTGTLGQIIDTSTPNDSTTGTTALMLAKMSGNTVVNCANADAGSNMKLFPVSANVAGSCAAGTTGNGCRVIAGKANITIDSGGIISGHFVGCSATQAPKGTDLGASVPPGDGCAGMALATAAGGTVVTIDTNACAVPAATGYATIANAGVNVAQRTKFNFVSGLNAVDNAGTAATDISVANPFKIADGSAAAPSFSLANSTTTGFHRAGADRLGFSIAGVYGGELNANGIFVSAASGFPGVFGHCTDATCATADTGITQSGGIAKLGNGASANTTGRWQASGYISAGTKFASNNGCTESALVGGGTAGKFTVGQNTACTIVITMGDSATAPNGWSCWAYDQTAVPAVAIRQTASSTTTASLLMTVGLNDVVTFGCIGY